MFLCSPPALVCGVCAFLFHRERGKKICREKDLEQNETTQREREREGKEREGDGEGAAVVDPEEGVEVFFFVSKKKHKKIVRRAAGVKRARGRTSSLLSSLCLSLFSLSSRIFPPPRAFPPHGNTHHHFPDPRARSERSRKAGKRKKSWESAAEQTASAPAKTPPAH